MDQRTERNLLNVHSDLVAVFKAAYDKSKLKPIVTEGRRSYDRQASLVKAGASRTMNSRHLSGHAVDIAFVVNGKVRWDWPLYKAFADVMKLEAGRAGIKIVWGGDWRTFKDGPHFELDRKAYPATVQQEFAT